MSSSGGSASSTTGAPNCPRRDGDSTCTSVVNALTDNDGGAPLRDGVPPGAESASIGQAALPTKVDWPSDLLCKLLVQSGVSNKFGNIEAIASQSTRGANDTVDVGTVVTDPTGLTASDKFATRPDELISVVLEHILPGLKKSTSPDNECIDATKITWGITQEGYNSSTLGSIKDAASAKFALSMNKESTRSTRSKCIHLLLLYCCMSWYVFVLVVLSHIHVSFASDPPCFFGWFCFFLFLFLCALQSKVPPRVQFHHRQASNSSPCSTTSVHFQLLLIGPKEAVDPTRRLARLTRGPIAAPSQEQCSDCAISAPSGGTTILSALSYKMRKSFALQNVPGYNNPFANLYEKEPRIGARAAGALLFKLHRFSSCAQRMMTTPRGAVVVTEGIIR